MKPWFARLHRWLGLVVGLQVLIWLASGLTMSLLDPAAVEGARTRAPAPEARPWPAGVLPPASLLSGVPGPVDAIESAWLLDRPVWRIVAGDRVALRDAYRGTPVALDEVTVAAIARRDYRGAARPQRPMRLQVAPLEARGHAGPVWRVAFDDAAHTTLYVSDMDGRILERRTDAFRLFDIAWMLHIMDYTGRSDFNHPLVVGMAGGGVLLALSGLWLLGSSVRAGAFRPRAWRRRVSVRVLDGEGPGALVPAWAGESVLVALDRSGIHLPSQCGGGQTCGQCGVRVTDDAPAPTAGERAHIPGPRLAQGDRLACAIPVRAGMTVRVPSRALLATVHSARVERITPVGPSLREVVLRPDDAIGPFRAGQFIQVQVPPFEASASALSDARAPLPPAVLACLPAVIANASTLERAYSPSLPPAIADGLLPLLVRLDHDVDCGRVGPGSAYLFTRRVGDRVAFRGPLGPFRLQPGAREKIFIGGGAGLAPLRAMVHERLAASGPERMHLWIGARTPSDVPYRDELEALATAHVQLDVHLVYSAWNNTDAGPLWVHEAVYEGLLRSHGALAECEFYLCGPPAMLDAARRLLADIGIDPSRIAFDDFG